MAQLPLTTLTMVGTTQNPSTTANPDGTQASPNFGRHQDLLTSRIHGVNYVAAARGNLYWGTSGTAGAKILAPGGTTAGFVLYNPAGSGKLISVEQFRMAGGSTETSVIAGLALEGSVQAPSGTLTGASISGFPLGAVGLGVAGNTGIGAGRVYLAATIVAMTFLGSLGQTITATTSPPSTVFVNFDGALVLQPGMAVNVVSTITEGGTDFQVCDWVWSEWLA